MTRYHINHEGKVYPCRAKVLKCPYSESLHSDNKIELYYKMMNSKDSNIEPSNNAIAEVRKINRLKSLYSMSMDIEKSDAPVELIAHTLKESLKRLNKHDLESEERRWKIYIDDESEHVYDVLNSGYKIPQNVPKEIALLAKEKFRERRGSVPVEYASSSRNESLMRARRNLANKDFSSFINYKKNSLTKENYEGTYRWMTRDFEKFTHDLNTSKMITQPMFYGDLKKSKEVIKGMDDYELLSAFDDYSVTDKEIESNVKDANYFKYTDRRDLSDNANKKLADWYELNRKIYQNWKINTPKRVFLSMEIADELDRREVYRPDGSISKMFNERKDG